MRPTNNGERNNKITIKKTCTEHSVLQCTGYSHLRAIR